MAIYFYVDESGVHSKGQFFIVSVVAVDGDAKDELETWLKDIEAQSGKQRIKWSKSKRRYRLSYMRAVLDNPELKYRIYVVAYKGRTDYVDMTIEATAKIIRPI